MTWQALNSACDTLEPGLAKRILPDKDRQGTDSFKDGWSLLAPSGLNGRVAQDVWNLVDVTGTLLLASSSSENGVPAVHLVKAFIKTKTGSRHVCLCSHVFKAKLLALVAQVDASFFDAQRSRTHQKANGLSKDGIRWLRDKGFTDLPLPDPDALTDEEWGALSDVYSCIGKSAQKSSTKVDLQAVGLACTKYLAERIKSGGLTGGGGEGSSGSGGEGGEGGGGGGGGGAPTGGGGGAPTGGGGGVSEGSAGGGVSVVSAGGGVSGGDEGGGGGWGAAALPEEGAARAAAAAAGGAVAEGSEVRPPPCDEPLQPQAGGKRPLDGGGSVNSSKRPRVGGGGSAVAEGSEVRPPPCDGPLQPQAGGKRKRRQAAEGLRLPQESDVETREPDESATLQAAYAQHRKHPGVYAPPCFAQNELGVHPGEVFKQMVDKYPVRKDAEPPVTEAELWNDCDLARREGSE